MNKLIYGDNLEVLREHIAAAEKLSNGLLNEHPDPKLVKTTITRLTFIEYYRYLFS